MASVGTRGLWVRFRVKLVPSLGEIRTIWDDLEDYLKAIARGVTGLANRISGEGEPPPGQPSLDGPRGDVSPELFDPSHAKPDAQIAAFVGQVAAAEPVLPAGSFPRAVAVPGHVAIEEISAASFAGLETIVAELNLTVDLSHLPVERRLDVAERVQYAVIEAGGNLYFEVVKRLVNGPDTSAPGRPPALVTGELVDSIRLVASPDLLGAAVGTDLDRGRYLEFGTRDMAARPFLFPVFEREKKRIKATINQEVSGRPQSFPGMKRSGN